MVSESPTQAITFSITAAVGRADGRAAEVTLVGFKVAGAEADEVAALGFRVVADEGFVALAPFEKLLKPAVVGGADDAAPVDKGFSAEADEDVPGTEDDTTSPAFPSSSLPLDFLPRFPLPPFPSPF